MNILMPVFADHLRDTGSVDENGQPDLTTYDGDPVVWRLDRAIELVRQIQPELHRRHYHVALGGGVLNKGYSTKDLDLYFFPFNESSEPIASYLVKLFGPSEDIYCVFDPNPAYANNSGFARGLKFLEYPGGRIDAFLLGDQNIHESE